MSTFLKVLSIDWDYMIEADSNQRARYFPDGVDLGIDIQNIIWASHYAGKRDEILKIGIKEKEYTLLKEILQKQVSKQATFGINESHIKIIPLLNQFIGDDAVYFDIYNADFHHDIWECRNGDKLDCGNWFRGLYEKGFIRKGFWIRTPKDSKGVEASIDKDFRKDFTLKKLSTLDQIKDIDFDIVFICKSSAWSPPHLDKYYIDLVNGLGFNNESIDEDNTLVDRWDVSQGLIDAEIKIREEMKRMMENEKV